MVVEVADGQEALADKVVVSEAFRLVVVPGPVARGPGFGMTLEASVDGCVVV